MNENPFRLSTDDGERKVSLTNSGGGPLKLARIRSLGMLPSELRALPDRVA